jgi:hypothetical protein
MNMIKTQRYDMPLRCDDAEKFLTFMVSVSFYELFKVFFSQTDYRKRFSTLIVKSSLQKLWWEETGES